MKNAKHQVKKKNLNATSLNRLFPHGKKGFNDMVILAVIAFILIGTGVILAFVDAEFGTSVTTFNTEGVANQFIEEELTDVTDVKASSILASVGKMFLWTFGELPFWLDIIFLVLRIILLAILIRNFVPFIGGSG